MLMKLPTSISGPLPLLLLSIYFLANGLHGMAALVPISEILAVLAIILLFSLPGIIIARVLFREREKMWVMAFMFQLYFLFSRAMFTMLRPFLFHWTFFLVSAVAFVLLWLIVKKSSVSALVRFRTYLVLVFLVLTSYEIFSPVEKEEPFHIAPAPAMQAWAGKAKPNIYLLLFDEYQGNTGLDTAFNFQNDAIVEFLEHEGFSIARNSVSAYNTTFYSVLSLFNMDTLAFPGADPLLSNKGIIKANHLLATANPVTQFLRQNGYRIDVNSIFNVDGAAATGPIITTVTWRQIQILRTLYGWCFDVLFNHIPSNRMQKALKSLSARHLLYNQEVEHRTLMPDEHPNQPRFVYSHFMLPHLPILLDEKGQELSFAAADRELHLGLPSLKINYPKQVGYANQVITRVVNHLTATDPNAVLIVLSDHGCRDVMHNSNGVFNIQWAMKIPGKKLNLPDAELHLVNTFRILFNEIGGQRLDSKSITPRIVN